MKKFLFALPILALAVLFTYCSKSEVKDELSAVDSSLQAANRGTCLVTVNAASPTTLTFCGTKTNLIKCTTCGPNPQAQGWFQSTGVSPFNFTVQSPITFYVSSATANTITLTTGTNTLGPLSFPQAGGCYAITVEDDCTIHL